MDRSHNELYRLRESYYSLKIGADWDEQKEEVWVKKLRNILENDIHQKSLGCHIKDTHIKIGTGIVHMNSFFEAQILFSHAKWISRFTSWLEQQLKGELGGDCLVIGYDTYIEPLLANLKYSNPDFRYCIYEEPGDLKSGHVSKPRLRYFPDDSRRLENINKVVFLCGISSTLSTFAKMRNAFESHLLQDQAITTLLEKIEWAYYSIVQVLAQHKNRFEFGPSDYLQWNRPQKIIDRITPDSRNFRVHYLVDVEAEWELATICQWCFPENPLHERPLVITDSSAVIPVQQIGTSPEPNKFSSTEEIRSKEDEMNLELFFKKDQSSKLFLYQDYLYYSHIVRGDHHFRYYIRTNSFFGDIVMKSPQFSDYCKRIRQRVQMLEGKQNENVLHILISPLHFSNNRFPHEINRRVFNNAAHEISFDPSREYRSNFETKYSNYAYILKQVNHYSEGKVLPKICFYYVDDEIITGETFYRAKSFVLSLLHRYAEAKDELLKRCEVFSAVFTLIDRTSDSTRRSYVLPIENYFSFLQFSVPTPGNYGDTCPICKEIEECRKIEENCCLGSTECYWKEREEHLYLRTLEEAREAFPTQTSKIRQRHFTRLYCENKLCQETENIWGEQELIQKYIETIANELRNLEVEQQYEVLISFLKAISRAPLYYKENGKKAAMRVMLTILKSYLSLEPAEQVNAHTDCSLCDLIKMSATELDISLDKPWKQWVKKWADPQGGNNNLYVRIHYQLLCVLLSCLSNIGSNYLIAASHIDKVCNYVAKLNKKYCCFSSGPNFRNEGLQGFYTLLVNYMKRLICGVSGREKSIRAEKELTALLRQTNVDAEREKLYQVLYLENIRFSSEDEVVKKKVLRAVDDNNQNIITKYRRIGKELADISSELTCTFFADFGGENVELAQPLQLSRGDIVFSPKEEEELVQMGYFISENDRKCFWVMFQAKGDYDSRGESKKRGSYRPDCEKNIGRVYLRLQFQKEKLENYKVIRKILIQRRTILKIVQADIETGALKAAIQAKAAGTILETGKTLSHGRSKDLTRMLSLVRRLFALMRDTEETDREYEAYNALNIFMNRCIAEGATNLVVRQIFSPPPGLQPFGSSVLQLKRPGDCVKDLENYFRILEDKNSGYFENIIKSMQDKVSSDQLQSGGYKIAVSISPDTFEKIRKIWHVPTILIADDAPDMVQLIGVLDVFIRNAVEHSGQACEIEISCEMGESVVPQDMKENDPYTSYDHCYRMTVKNKMPIQQRRDTSHIGFTKLFFTEYLNQHCGADYRYFRISMEEKANRYESQFLCVAPVWSERS